MAEPKAKTEYNPLVLQAVYPDAEALFTFEPRPLASVTTDCLIVLDTNALLLPYNTGKESLAEIEKALARLRVERRLVVPGQVAREFVQNRAEKLKTVFQQISQKRNIAVKRQSYPLLESVATYQDLLKIEAELDEHVLEYRKAVAAVLDQISSWSWNDPVSQLYRRLFAGVVYDPKVNEESLLSELAHRQTHRIPPGYEDAAKEDRGVGDLLIWHTILEVGQQRNRDVVLVSGDEKADWWHQSENQALFPRFELVEEYRRASDGRSFHIISFAELLEAFGASTEVVAEVRHEEVALSLTSAEDIRQDTHERALRAEHAVARWLRGRAGGHIGYTRAGRPVFLVGQADGVDGYEVLFMRTARHMRERIHHRERWPQLQGVVPERRYIVLVSEELLVVDEILSGLERISQLFPALGFVVGLVNTDEEFIEFERVDGMRRQQLYFPDWEESGGSVPEA